MPLRAEPPHAAGKSDTCVDIFAHARMVLGARPNSNDSDSLFDPPGSSSDDFLQNVNAASNQKPWEVNGAERKPWEINPAINRKPWEVSSEGSGGEDEESDAQSDDIDVSSVESLDEITVNLYAKWRTVGMAYRKLKVPSLKSMMKKMALAAMKQIREEKAAREAARLELKQSGASAAVAFRETAEASLLAELDADARRAEQDLLDEAAGIARQKEEEEHRRRRAKLLEKERLKEIEWGEEMERLAETERRRAEVRAMFEAQEDKNRAAKRLVVEEVLVATAVEEDEAQAEIEVEREEARVEKRTELEAELLAEAVEEDEMQAVIEKEREDMERTASAAGAKDLLEMPYQRYEPEGVPSYERPVPLRRRREPREH